jgi:hypothetical protein
MIRFHRYLLAGSWILPSQHFAALGARLKAGRVLVAIRGSAEKKQRDSVQKLHFCTELDRLRSRV